MQNISMRLRQDNKGLRQDSKSRTMNEGSTLGSPLILNVSKKILARQSIFRNIDCNISQQIKRGYSIISQQQIKTSSIYEKLVQRIKKLKKRQQQQIKEHKKMMQQMDLEMKYLKTAVQQDKIQIWETKNQVIELQQCFDQQIQQYNQLYQELHAQEQQDEDEEQGQYNGQQNTQNDIDDQDQSAHDSQNITSQQDSLKSQDKQQYSKPSCSIKYFISNRSITSPGLSKQNLQIGSGIALHAQDDNQSYTQLYVREQQQRPSPQTQHTFLSFKKNEHLFCQHQNQN